MAPGTQVVDRGPVLTYVAVISKRGGPLGDAALGPLLDADRIHRLHISEAYHLWKAPSGSVALALWSAAHEKFGSNGWVLADGGVAAISGVSWYGAAAGGAPGLLTPQQVWDHGRCGPTDLRSHSTGSASMIRLEADGTGWVASDDTGTGHVYRCETDELLVLATDPELAAEVADPRKAPERDIESMAWMPYYAGMWGDTTSVSDVTVLPASSHVRLDPRPHFVRDTTPWQEGRDTELDVDDLIDAAVEALVSQVRAIAEAPFEGRTLSLSGGRDSRVLLAAMDRAGVLDAFEFRTIGVPGVPDREVAQELGARVGAPVKTIEPTVTTMTTASLAERLYRHVHQTAGMFGAWNLKGTGQDVRTVQVSGLYGELMRSHYKPERPLKSLHDARRFFVDDLRMDEAGLLLPAVRARREQAIHEWVVDRHAAGWAPADLPDLFYAEHRIGRWAGAAQAANSLNANAGPLASRACIVAGFALGHGRRMTDELPFRIIQRLQPRLLDVPLAETAWHPSVTRLADRPLPPPLTGGPPRSSGIWQVDNFQRMRVMFASELNRTDSPISQIVDLARCVELLKKPPSGSYSRAQLWAAAGAAIWLARRETPWVMVGPSPEPRGLARGLAAVADTFFPVVSDADGVTGGTTTQPSGVISADREELDKLRARKSVRLALAVADRARPAVRLARRMRQRRSSAF